MNNCSYIVYYKKREKSNESLYGFVFLKEIEIIVANYSFNRLIVLVVSIGDRKEIYRNL
jgi:hypothetical protein